MEFLPLYFKDRLQAINPLGDVGVVTLWTPVERVRQQFVAWSVDLQPETSRVAVMGNLYGNGLPELLRNLAWNPQIRHLLVLGRNLSGSREELTAFFHAGLETTLFLGTSTWRIVGTQRKIDGLVTPELFGGRIAVTPLGSLRDPETQPGVAHFFAHLPPPQPVQGERLDFPLPVLTVQHHPSEPLAHTVVGLTPMAAWRELIFRIVRFGHRTRLRKGERIELPNVKVIVKRPVEETAETLSRHGFSLDRFRAYQKRIMDPTPPQEESYTYGNRLRGYFRPTLADTGDPDAAAIPGWGFPAEGQAAPLDGLELAITHLRADPETRNAYISLWDNSRDLLPETHGHPCLVTLFLRKFAGALHLTATFRSHNAMDAWPENCYGLMAIQARIAEAVALPCGPLTIFSHSISVDPLAMERAQAVAKAWSDAGGLDPEAAPHGLRPDPHGEFQITTDPVTREIVLQHSFEGQRLTEYRGRTPMELERQLVRDMAVADISHALYLGREIARHVDRVQDDG
ncbi:MAG: hypothetical protein HQL63_03630 [Magnetococcales bacterium]|nr:hypothetical protein [Magnetococcales bacterium]